MLRRKHNGCITWGGSIVTAAFISILIGILTIACFIEIASLRIVRKEEKIQTELEANLNSIPTLSNSVLFSHESRIEKDKYCLYIGPQVIIDVKYSADVQPIAVFNYYNQKLKEQGWDFVDTRGTDWNNDKIKMPYLEASYYKEGGYYALVEYAREYSNSPWTYHLQMKWQGGNYPCN